MALGISTNGMKPQSAGISSSSIPNDEDKFRSYIHEKFYTESESQNLIKEKTIELEDPREYSGVVQEINT